MQSNMSRFTTPIRLGIAAILLFLAAIGSASAQGYDNNYGNASYQEFYDDLSPYGEWVNDPEYGYVWVPDAGDDFRPYYTNGYWANTDYGNTWVSNYRWGWAPFHYGRWTYSNYYGWTWIPGNTWGPAWVSWRSGGGAYGWAPMGPGISINMSFGNGYYVPDNWWTFTPQQYILNQGFHQYSYGPRYNNNYIRQTTIINNTYVYNNNTYVTGPRRGDLERATGRPVRTLAINNNSRPDRTTLRGDRLNVYRPQISESRPRATERPRTFQASREPISSGAGRNLTTTPDRGTGRRPSTIDRSGMQQQQQDRTGIRSGQMPERQMPDRAQPAADRPVRSGRDFNASPSPSRTDRMPVERAPVQQPQPDRRFDRQPDRITTPMQPQRTERMPMNRNNESPAMQQAPARQQRFEQPRMEQRQAPAMQPQQQRQAAPMQRMETAPRTMPQREMSAPVQRNGGSDGRLRGR